jgi:hypothetical protein
MTAPRRQLADGALSISDVGSFPNLFTLMSMILAKKCC